ncbi:hypothetical protein RhiirA5_431368 [Rhizophagus irregularis]|uniref:Uncharacterized protein n=1 Tax=Rhizophagus irregularis TaxID=588596 RepID=A0A2N0NV55_9GLOM|nr:hypothetical protein RhiirA5_431368 [Rhizophagus irregularis]
MSLEMRTDTKTSEKSKSNIWKYFTKERGQDNKITAKCNYYLPFTIVEGWLKWILKKVTGGFHLIFGLQLLSNHIWEYCTFINNSWHLQQITLDFIELKGSHTGKNIAEELITVLNLYDISKKINSITTDKATPSQFFV